MAKLGLPSIDITFKSIGITAIERSQRGIVVLILKEKKVAAADGVAGNEALFAGAPYTVYTSTDIPDGLKADNQEQIELTLMGYQTAPKHVLLYVQDATAADYNEILIELEHARWDYLVIPEIKDSEVMTIATWIKGMRTVKKKKVKSVLPNCPADFDGIVNFTNTKIVTKAKTYTAAQYCSRIAGMICGTPMTISCTYAPLPEVIDCDKYTDDQMIDKVGKGELFIMYDGEEFKIARGVNSFVTTIQDKGDQFKKIKLVDLMDMIYDDIYGTAKRYYIGKYSNSCDNKCLLISAIQGYYTQLELDGLLEKDQNDCWIDLEATAAWILSNGKKTKAEIAEMKILEIKEFNTGDNVFLASGISMLDAIENIKLGIAV
jgi:Phage tail sheath protein.